MPLLVEGLCPFLTSDVVNNCKAAGIRTVLDFLSFDAESLSQRTSIPYKTVTSIRRVLLACYSPLPRKADSLYDELLSSLSILNTGHCSLDDLLDGGIYTGEITEIHGPPGAGKTQLCLSMVSELIWKTGKTIVYIDSNSSFCAERVIDFLHQKTDKETDNSQQIMDALSKIHVINVCDVFYFFDILHYLKEGLKKKEDSFFSCLNLIIIDALTTLIAPCLGGLQYDGMGIMMSVAQQLKTLCCEHKLAVVITNNTVHAEDSAVKSALGRFWRHIPSVVICVDILNTKSSSERKRKISVVKSCRKSCYGELCLTFSGCKMLVSSNEEHSG